MNAMEPLADIIAMGSFRRAVNVLSLETESLEHGINIV